MAEEENKLKTGQKLAAGVLAVFGIFVVIMWVGTFRNAVYGPFQYRELTQAGICPGGNCPDEGDRELFNKDTDKDGLSDWDELNVYGTSPYIEDSDSDGYSDKSEIETGFDPNCPKGRDCGAFNLTKEKEQTEEESFSGSSDLELLNSLFELEEMGSNLEVEGGQIEETEGLEGVLTGGGNVEQLRALLLESGMEKEMLDQISDEVLMETYQDLLENN